MGLFARVTTMWEVVPFILLLEGVFALQLVNLEVPEIVRTGSQVRLSCIYRLDGDQLYSIKWYKDDMEFFRYVPIDRPPGQFFPLLGIKIDLDKSINGTLYIKDVDDTSSGIYRCEVSADAPSFQTVSAEKPMSVQAGYNTTGKNHVSTLRTIFLFPLLLLLHAQRLGLV